jgi:predicted DNA-binding ribbon-helix-helix protein
MGPYNRSHLRQELTRDARSAIVKRSVVIAGHKTSVSLEDAFWGNLKEIARSREMTLSKMVGYISGQRGDGNLSSSIRLFVLEHVRARCGIGANAQVAEPDEVGAAHPC